GNPSTPFSARKKRSLDCVLSPNPASMKEVRGADLVRMEDDIRRSKKRAQPSVRESLFGDRNVELEPALVVEILNEESQERKCKGCETVCPVYPAAPDVVWLIFTYCTTR